MPVVVPEKNALVLNLRDPERVKAVIPYFEEIAFEGRNFIAVPHTLHSMRILKNLGIKVKGCEVFRYKYNPPLIRGRYKAMVHQLETAVFLTDNPRAFCLHPPRMGKTAGMLLGADFLKQQRAIRSALVVAPVSCLRTVWEAETFGLFPHWSVAVLHGTKQRRQRLLRDDYDLYIINPDGLKVINAELEEAVRSGKIGLVILDESTDYANSDTDRWEAANKIVAPAEYAWAATGTPGDPMDVYGQIKLINPRNVPPSKTAWRNTTMYQTGNPAFRQFKPLPGAEHEVEKALQPSIRYAKEDVLDLPPLQYLEYEAPLSREQLKTYETLRKDMLLSTEGGETVTAANAAVLMLKLLQVATGAVKADGGEPVMLDMHERLRVLDEIIHDAEYKVVIFAPFKATMTALVDHLSKQYTVERVDGDVVGRKRDTIFRNFQAQPDPHILVLHPKTASFGLELSAADTIVFFGPPLNGPFVYSQAVERINSVHQKSKSPAIVHLHSTPVERRLFRSIKDGVDLNGRIVEMFKEVITEAA